MASAAAELAAAPNSVITLGSGARMLGGRRVRRYTSARSRDRSQRQKVEPLSRVIHVFRSKCTDRVKRVWWDSTHVRAHRSRRRRKMDALHQSIGISREAATSSSTRTPTAVADRSASC